MPMDSTGELPAVAAARAAELRRRTRPPADCAVAERTIASPGGSLALRSYRPAAAESGASAGLVFFHAGAFVAGSPESHAAFCGQLSLGSACVVVSCAYRLAPEHRFPSALDDAYFAACFVHEHADELGIDHRRLAIGGIEVGASLATGVARLAKERRNPALGLQLLLYPALDLRASAYDETVGLYASESERAEPRCSPLLARNLIGLPPALIACASQASDAAAYAERLREAHVETTWVQCPEFLELPDDSAAGRDALRACSEALTRLLV